MVLFMMFDLVVSNLLTRKFKQQRKQEKMGCFATTTSVPKETCLKI